MSARAPKVSTRIVEHTIRDEDLREACARDMINADRFLANVRDARLEREWRVLSARLKSVFAQMEAAKARGARLLPYLEQIEKLEAERTQNMDERWPETRGRNG